MASEVENLLKEQKMANAHLELLDDNQETSEKIVSEDKETNKKLGSVDKNIVLLNTKLAANFKSLENVVSDLDISQVAPQPIAKSSAVEPIVVKLDEPEVEPKLNFDTIEAVINPKKFAKAMLPIMFRLMRLQGKGKKTRRPTVSTLTSGSLATSVGGPGALKEAEDSSKASGDPIPVSIASEKILDTLSEGDSSSNTQLVQINSGVNELVGLQKDMIEAQEDLGSTGGKPEPEVGGGDGDGILELLGLGFLAKFGKGKKLGKAFSKIGMFAKGFGKFIGRASGIATILFSLFDAFQGFSDEETLKEITGKSKDQLSLLERSGSALSAVLSGLTFGFVDAKKIFDFIKPGFAKVQEGMDFLFNPKTGSFSGVVEGVTNVVDKFKSGDILGGAFDVLKTVFFEIPRGFQNLWSDLGGKLLSFMSDTVLKMLPQGVQDFIGKRVTQIKAAKEAVASKVKSATDSVSKFFGFGDDDDKKFVEKTPGEPAGGVAGKAIAGSFTEQGKFVEARPDATTSLPVEDKSITKAIIQRPVGENIATPVSPITEPEKVGQLSKERMEERSKAAQATTAEPNVVVVPVPSSSNEKAQRRTETGDMSLAMLNSGLLDG